MAELEQRGESQTPIAQEVQNSQNGLRALPSQVTSTTPATKPAKNPKRVAAGKLAAEKTKQAREAQKKASIEAAAIIAKEKEKKSASAKRNVTPPGAPAPTEAPPESSGLTQINGSLCLVLALQLLQLMPNAKTSKPFSREKASKVLPPLSALTIKLQQQELKTQ